MPGKVDEKMKLRTPFKTDFTLLIVLMAMCSTALASQQDAPGSGRSSLAHLNTRNAEQTYGTALLTSQEDSMVAFRAGPSMDAAVMAWYYPGLEVHCLSDPHQQWVQVRFRSQ
jgi:hypothetical protein